MNANVSPVDLAYIAGFVDGEGTISIRRSNRGLARAGHESYDCVVSVPQKRRDILDWIKDTTGIGHVNGIRQYNNSFAKDGAISIFRWSCAATAAYEFMVDIQPYLRVKRAQADVLIAFYEYKKTFVRRLPGLRGTLTTPLDRIERYRAYCEQIQGLNGRKDIETGPRDGVPPRQAIPADLWFTCTACGARFQPDTYFSDHQLKNHDHYCKECRSNGSAARSISRRANARAREKRHAAKSLNTE